MQHRFFIASSLFASAGVLLAVGASAAAPATRHDTPMAEPEVQQERDWVDDRWQKTDVGQFLSGAIATPGQATYKGIAIKLGERDEASVCFDTDLLRMSAGWTGGFVKPDPARYGLIRPFAVVGTNVFVNSVAPGWANGGRFDDPRARPFGPLPRQWGKYRALYLSGRRVVLHYTVGVAEVWESPWCESRDGLTVITRSLEIAGTDGPMELAVCELAGATAALTNLDNARIATLTKGGVVTAIACMSDAAAELKFGTAGRLRLSIASRPDKARVKVLYWRGPVTALAGFFSFVKTSGAPETLDALTRGGPARWGGPLVTRGQVDPSPASAFAIDTLTMPYQNPWNALMFAGGHDFFPNGDAALCTVHGDVWRVSGIDDRLEKLTWRRFATGLYQPLGLKVINGKVHVLGRDQITVLEDVNGDGEADRYANFNSDAEVDAGSHGYAACLETDPAGNLYHVRCASGTIHSGSLLRISPDGSRLDVVATGFRNPNGLGVGPDGTITVADQEGEWVPATRLDVIQPGGFYGYMPAHHRPVKPSTYDPPLCWMPKVADNSAGGQVWVTSDSWGPLKGQMLHFSYGHCTMLLVLRETVPGQAQGGVVPLPGRFLSGVMRGAFNPRDGHLYVSGLRGWQTSAARDGCFQRVRCRAEKLRLPVGLAAHANGLRLTFSEPVEPAAAEDAGSFALERWNYRWTERYGSKDWSVEHPDKEGHDTVEVAAARLAADGRSVFLQVPDLKPAMQMRLRYHLKTALGQPFRGEVYHTIHRMSSAL